MWKKKPLLVSLLLAGFAAIGSLYGFGEKTLVLGADSGWNAVENRTRITEVPLIRPHPVLALNPGRIRELTGAAPQVSADMILSFDEEEPGGFADRTGNYRISGAPSLTAAGRQWAREGAGAARFSGEGEAALTIFPRNPDALFSPGGLVRDFTIEFWLYPFNAENGEQILSWTSARQIRPGEFIYQYIHGMFVRNRLRWTFTDFFSGPADTRLPPLSLTSLSPLVPQTWSHHLIRFDADTGMMEYVVNGKLEGTLYATPTGREGGDVYTPVIGREGQMVLGGHYTGILDEFRTYRGYVESPPLSRYPRDGGRAETIPLDLGERNTRILKVEVRGGRFSAIRTFGSGGRVYHEPAGTGNFSFSDNSALRFFIRSGNNPYGWTGGEPEWLPFMPGGELPGAVQGRFVQVAAVFYPSGDGETTPYLDEIRIIYKAPEPPAPPALVYAVARDGAVDLSWRANPAPEVGGYLVYYGESPGEYFGETAVPGPSPINAGKRTTLHIDGLRNGRLYFFSVAAYDRLEGGFPGAFSREVSARPLRMIE
ncbi:MAG: hypothetical protein LBL19_01225 [Spirochaetaceae bacterium]|jgi:hypothetical protein|nr:hypothetical protein [Spirochaetaceae bacterium]